MRALTTCVLAGTLAFAGTGHAQDESEPDNDKIIVTGPASAAPSRAHEYYEPIIGEWDMNWKLLNQEGEATREVEGQITNEWIVGGRWVQSTFDTDLDMGGERFHGIGIFGHDNTTGQYHNVWFESNRTAVQYDVGSYDTKTRTFTYEGDQPRPDGTRFTTRTTMRIDSNDKHTINLYVVRDEGEPAHVLELTMTRADADAADADTGEADADTGEADADKVGR